jgi:hypothetical protein
MRLWIIQIQTLTGGQSLAGARSNGPDATTDVAVPSRRRKSAPRASSLPALTYREANAGTKRQKIMVNAELLRGAVRPSSTHGNDERPVTLPRSSAAPTRRVLDWADVATGALSNCYTQPARALDGRLGLSQLPKSFSQMACNPHMVLEEQ